jgi:hypothetical protein
MSDQFKKSAILIVLFVILLIPVILAQLQQPPATPEVVETEIAESETVEESEETEEPGGSEEVSLGELGAAAKAVDLIAAWVDAGASETEAFEYEGTDGNAYQASYEMDILPLFTESGVWYEGSQACTGCHFANTETSYHEMDLTSYKGIMKGGDVLSEPPGVPLLGQSEVGANDFDFGGSKLRARLRNNRMPPGWPFDITETNRDGACVAVSDDGVEVQTDSDGKIEYSCDLSAVGLIEAWVDAGASETETFEYGDASLTFANGVQPFFTEGNMWFDGSQACSGCHFANSETSYHEMDLSTYEGIMKGGDVLSEPPGVPILGQSEIDATDYDFAHSKLRERLRNNRMTPGIPFDITEENRAGPLVLHGSRVEIEEEEIGDLFGTGECEVNTVLLIEAWVDAGAPESEAFDFSDEYGATCSGSFEADVLPLFTENGAWFQGSQACTGCHFANTETSYHEMNLSTYEGIMKGGDVLSEPPGVPLLGQSEVGASDFDFGHSKLRERLRNNRMPPGWIFDITETNRDGACVTASNDGVEIQTDSDGKIEYGCDINAVGLIEAWVEAGAPETDTFEYDGTALTFTNAVQPFFTEANMWFDGSQACTGCHFDNSENSYHEMDLGTYEGIMKGGDVLSEPPGVPILGQSEVGATDYDFAHSKLRERLRNNRMPPGIPFDITEGNRNGPIILAGTKQ